MTTFSADKNVRITFQDTRTRLVESYAFEHYKVSKSTAEWKSYSLSTYDLAKLKPCYTKMAEISQNSEKLTSVKLIFSPLNILSLMLSTPQADA